MFKFLQKIEHTAIMALAIITIVAGSIYAGGGQRAWQGSSGQPESFLVEVAKGNIPGHSIIHKFGHGNVGTTFVPICNALVYQTPTTAIALEVVSSDADDTSAGAGARTVFIEGLALDGSIVTQTVALNGLTAVPIPTNLWRLYRWGVLTSGVYATTGTGSHQGVLTIRVASAGATWSTISITGYPHGQSEIGWYTVPGGYTAYILTQIVKVDSTKSVDIMFVKRNNADTVAAPFSAMTMVEEFIGVAGSGSGLSPDAPVSGFGAFTDIGWLGKVTSSTGDVSVDFEILLIKNGY
jgi:hypothetical protein